MKLDQLCLIHTVLHVIVNVYGECCPTGKS